MANGTTSRRRLDRRLWVAWLLVLAVHLWPLRELTNSIEPFIGPLPLTLAWQFLVIATWIVIYIVWMARVWLPDAAESEHRAGGAPEREE